jgi:hypothetical protein
MSTTYYGTGYSQLPTVKSNRKLRRLRKRASAMATKAQLETRIAELEKALRNVWLYVHTTPSGMGRQAAEDTIRETLGIMATPETIRENLIKDTVAKLETARNRDLSTAHILLEECLHAYKGLTEYDKWYMVLTERELENLLDAIIARAGEPALIVVGDVVSYTAYTPGLNTRITVTGTVVKCTAKRVTFQTHAGYIRTVAAKSLRREKALSSGGNNTV